MKLKVTDGLKTSQMTFSLHVIGRWPDPDTVMYIQRALFGLAIVSLTRLSGQIALMGLADV